MSLFEFSLILDIPGFTPQIEELLFEAGCDDALLGVEDGVAYIDFSREAATFPAAVSTAIQQVESVLDTHCVVRIEPDELVTLAEISTRVGRTRESIRLLASGRRGQGQFPLPLRGAKTRPRIWRWSEVAPWLSGHGISVHEQDVLKANMIAEVNAILQLRRFQPQQGARLLGSVFRSK